MSKRVDLCPIFFFFFIAKYLVLVLLILQIMFPFVVPNGWRAVRRFNPPGNDFIHPSINKYGTRTVRT